MTALGKYLAKRSINKSEVARRTGISKARINELTLNPTTKLRAYEVYLIALAIHADPCEVLKEVCGHLKLKPVILCFVQAVFTFLPSKLSS